MPNNPIKDFENLYDSYCTQVIHLLIRNHRCFSIWCDMKEVVFTPNLPKEIAQKFRAFELFVLAGYTFESLGIHTRFIEFEAGFGADNIGSLVRVNLKGIYQIIIKDINDNDIPLFSRIDSSLIFDDLPKEDDNPISIEHIENLDNNEIISIQAILSNKENRKTLKNLKDSLNPKS